MANSNGENKTPETKTPAKTEESKPAEPRNLTREMLAMELGEEEARRRIP